MSQTWEQKKISLLKKALATPVTEMPTVTVPTEIKIKNVIQFLRKNQWLFD